MQLGMVGLGKMGASMTLRLSRGGHEVVAFDVNADTVTSVTGEASGSVGAASLEEMVSKLEAPRAVWIMVPAGAITQSTIDRLADLLEPGDTIIDGGNSRFTDSIARGEMLAAKSLNFIDAGTSGGIWGLSEGYCLMVGGPADVCARLEPLFTTLAPEHGYARVGETGAGHFTKMVHNGVEYALMQAYAEGFEILDASRFDLDLARIAELWRHGSVVRSWLLDLAADALRKDPHLDELEGYVADSGEGRWTVEEAINTSVPAPTIALSLFARFASRQENAFGNRMLAALRNEFGGHAVVAKHEQ